MFLAADLLYADIDICCATTALLAVIAGLYGCRMLFYAVLHHRTGSAMSTMISSGKEHASKPVTDEDDKLDLSVLPCIRNRRSVFPKQYLRDPPPLNPAVIESLLEAARWGPYHGRCYAGCQHPAKFVVLGKKSMVEMQQLTLRFYDRHWQDYNIWGGCSREGETSLTPVEAYQEWRQMTEDEITGRWGPVSYMIAIIMRRQTGPKRLPEWEEAAAVACAVQNMHLQSTKFRHLACYWSSWHDAVRNDCQDLKDFLNMESEDKCMGFFIVAQIKPDPVYLKDRRTREESVVAVEWRA